MVNWCCDLTGSSDVGRSPAKPRGERRGGALRSSIRRVQWWWRGWDSALGGHRQPTLVRRIRRECSDLQLALEPNSRWSSESCERGRVGDQTSNLATTLSLLDTSRPIRPAAFTAAPRYEFGPPLGPSHPLRVADQGTGSSPCGRSGEGGFHQIAKCMVSGFHRPVRRSEIARFLSYTKNSMSWIDTSCICERMHM